MIRNYELVAILDPEQVAEEQEKLLKKIEKFVLDAEGKISQKKDWGKKELASLVKKRKIGFYVYYELILPSNKVASFKQKLQNEDNILRYLLIEKEGGRA